MASVSKAMIDLKDNILGSPALLSGAVFLLVACFVTLLINRSKRLDLPVIEVHNGDYKGALLRGSAKYPDTPFILPTNPPTVILPATVLNEVRNLPETEVSFIKDVQKMMLYKHTGLGEDRREVINAVKSDLTRHISSTLDGLQDEIRYAFNRELRACEEWTSFVLYDKLVRVIAFLSGRVFVGRPLSREEEWIDSSVNFTRDCMLAREAVFKTPAFLQPFVTPFLPEIRSVKHHRARATKLLRPMVDAVLKRSRDEKSGLDDFEDEQGTMINWMMRYTDDHSPELMGNLQMGLSFAAIHTTTMATCHAILDLVSRTEYIQPLRDEIQRVIDEDGQDVDGEGFLKLKKTSLTKLRKLDSFMKESQRLSPPGFASMNRLTITPLQLSTGHTIPPNTRIAFPSFAISTSPASTTYSPSYNPPSNKPPTEFDGFRFYNLRTMKGKENKHQFVTTSMDHIVFGHGNHACPGRFFASNEIKVVLIELLRSWDFRLKGDVEGKGGEHKMPKGSQFQLSYSPNRKTEIEFRRRKE